MTAKPEFEVGSPSEGDLAFLVRLKLRKSTAQRGVEEPDWKPTITSDTIDLPKTGTVPISEAGPNEVEPGIWEALWFELATDKATTADLDVKVAYHSWSTISRTSFRNGAPIFGKQFILKPFGGVNGLAVSDSVSAPYPTISPDTSGKFPSLDRQWVAFDKKHRPIPIHMTLWSDSEPIVLVVDRPSEVTEVDIQTRPFTVVEFRDIQTHPNARR